MPTNAPTHAVPDSSLERLRAVWIHRLLSLAAPWAVAVLTIVAAAKAHGAWGHRGAGTAAAVAGLAAGVVIITAAAVAATRHYPVLVRAHSAATAAVAGTWLCLAVVTGLHSPVTAYLGVLGGVVTCLTWNIRRGHKAPQSDGTAAARITDLFADAADPAGLKGAKMTVTQVGPRKIKGLLKLRPGEHTAADAVRRAANLESGMHLPPGSITAAEHPDRADYAQVTLTDPRLMRTPIPWPGPSRPAASIEEPIRLGLWQDADPCEVTVPGYHVQVMGMTGSAKSLGGGWNWLGEVITREDAAVFGVDITKGDQTMGPLSPALHGLASDLTAARWMLADFRSIVRPRTDYLASRGLQRWARGCGLSYLILWLEECPDIFDALTEKQMEAFTSLIKTMRSAGMTIVLSLQRSTYDQMPTILRGQLANWCFGVANSADAKYGLSERQEEGGAAPERWQQSQPGMAYLDAPGVPEDRIAMPMRCYFWGDNADVMTAHAARFPAAARPLDELTARLLADARAARLGSSPRAARAAPPAAPPPTLSGNPLRQFAQAVLSGEIKADDETRAAMAAAEKIEQDREGAELAELDAEAEAALPADLADDEDQDQDTDEDEDDPETVRAEYLTEPDPDPDLIAGIDDPIEAPADDVFGALEFPAPDRADPADARDRFRALLAEWVDEGRQEFGTSDLYELLSAVGMSRAWLHKQINVAIEDGLIAPVTDAEKGRFGRYELCEPESDAA